LIFPFFYLYKETSMRYNQAKTTAVGLSKETIAGVRRRSNDRCEMCGRNAWLEMSHRTAKGMGGAHGDAVDHINSAENIDHLCTLCHRMLMHRERSTINGESCKTCWMRVWCLAKAQAKGLIDEDWRGPHPERNE
jgi:hypothetical protein